MPDGFDPYKILQVDSEAEDEVIQAAYRRLARKYHPDLAETPEAAARMSSINAAWEMIGDPAKRAAYDRYASGGRGGDCGGVRAGAAASADRAHRAPHADRDATDADAPPPDVVSRDWTSGRSTQGGGFDESMRAAEGHGAAGPPPGRPSGTVLNFGRYAGLVARRGRSPRHRVHRMARPGADRAELPRRARRDPALDAAGASRPKVTPPTGAGSTAGARRRQAARPASRRGRIAGRAGPCGRRPSRSSCPGSSSVNRTTPKVISWSSARCGMSAGSDSAIATATAPRRPAQNRTCNHEPGMRSASPGPRREARHATEEDVHDDRTTDQDRDDAPGDRAQRRRAAAAGGIARPTSRNTNAVRR